MYQKSGVTPCHQKTGFGAGKLNVAGGKIKSGESVLKATIRELKEEFGLVGKQSNLMDVATLHFYFAGKLAFTCFVSTLFEWSGTPTDSKPPISFESVGVPLHSKRVETKQVNVNFPAK